MNTDQPEQPEQPKADPTPSSEDSPKELSPEPPPSETALPASPFAIIQQSVANVVVYAPSLKNGPFRQGEILSNVFQYRAFEPTSAEGAFIQPLQYELAIVVSHDCDLDQDFTLRAKIAEGSADYAAHKDNLLLSILLCPVSPEQAITDAIRSQGRTVRDRFRQNKEERYQFLRALDPEFDALHTGLSAMGIDFRRYFTLFTDELYGQLQTGCQRRCRLVSPYLEHLSRRFTNHLSRVGLPLDHHA
jgi:hypothetical protein